MSQTKSELGFIEKFGLKYFAFLINILIYVGTFQLTKSMEIVLLMVVFFPRIGSFLPNDDSQKQKHASQYNNHWYHMLAPVGSVVQLYLMLYYTWISYQQFNHSYQSVISAILSISLAASQTIDACHQLIHRTQKILKATGFVGLIPFLFTTYPIQHLYLHHKKVGTPEDDITAPKGKPYYSYYFQAVFSSYRQTFRYSKNFFVFCMILHLGYLFSLYQFALIEFSGDFERSLRKTAFFFGIALFGLFFMESIEYIEHYGLIYRKNSTEKPVIEMCSWNTTANPLYNWSIFRFQRHSDHHMNVYKIYSSLQLNQKMPLIPFSFPEAIAAAWIPQIWYNSMNHLVDRVLNNEKFTSDDVKRSKTWIRVSNCKSIVILLLNIYMSNNFKVIFGVK